MRPASRNANQRSLGWMANEQCCATTKRQPSPRDAARGSHAPRLIDRGSGPGTTSNFRSIKAMKMMDRPMAVADAEAIGRCDCGADPGLGMANRGFHLVALGQPRRDGGGQRASGAMA